MQPMRPSNLEKIGLDHNKNELTRKEEKKEEKKVWVTYIPKLISHTRESGSERGWRHLRQMDGNLHFSFSVEMTMMI